MKWPTASVSLVTCTGCVNFIEVFMVMDMDMYGVDANYGAFMVPLARIGESETAVHSPYFSCSSLIFQTY